MSEPAIYASVGFEGANFQDEVRTVQHLINGKLPPSMAPLDENGVCGDETIEAIRVYQRLHLRVSVPDGRIDPDDPTFRSLIGKPIGPVDPGPSPDPSLIPIAPGVARPTIMRETAWRYLLAFTKKHEGAVFNMYNNRTQENGAQDVTCGIGFRIETRSGATAAVLKTMFFDPTTNNAPSDIQMFADWDEAAKLTRTITDAKANTKSNLLEYAKVCHLRMHPEAVYNRMAIILRDEKLPSLLSLCKEDFKDFENFPAAAQVFSLSFAYGRIPTGFPLMTHAIRDKKWAEAAKNCHVIGIDESKNIGHKQLLLFAQKIQDSNGNFDAVPPSIL